MKNHIQNIEISNFKSIKDLKIDGCKKINIFAGKPNAGKSNILEAISMLKLGAINSDLREYLSFENYNKLFHLGNTEKEIRISEDDEYIEFNLKKAEVIYKSGNNKMFFESKFSNSIFLNDSMAYVVNSSEEYDEIERKNIQAYYFKKNHSFKGLGSKELNNFGENLAEVIFLDSINPKEESMATIISKFLPEGYKLLIDSDYELNLTTQINDNIYFTLPFFSLADTLQRLIFFKAAIMSNQNSVLLFEEPEAHCFEPYILEFTNEVKFNENNNQFFMVTHSDFIIQEFLRDEESRENTQIYLVNNVDGKTEVKKLNAEKNDDVYEFGMNLFFNFDSLWENN